LPDATFRVPPEILAEIPVAVLFCPTTKLIGPKIELLCPLIIPE